ncbi:putative sensor histidine kinase pdtaS [bacterium BMS3Abin05]|nr:putative sensor histidine kinase pdtaS [bacterium BMS3Abin05]GBE27733.1 putative sensor histidine kinase pdtaS [bacterium BMS3Bbin03]
MMSFKLNKSNGILYRMMSIIWFVIIFTISIFAFTIIPSQRESLIRNMESTAKIVATFVDQVAVSSIITGNYSAIVDQSMKIVNDRKSILYIVITPKNGNSIVHTAGKWRYQPLGSFWKPNKSLTEKGLFVRSNLVNQQVYHYSYPIRYSGIDWGWINVGLSVEQYHKDLRSIYIRTGLLAAIAILLGLVLSYIFARQISGPILCLNKVTKRIMNGDLTARAKAFSVNEVAELAHSFNRMTESLKKSQETLIAARDYINNIIHSMNESLIVASPDGIIRTVNQTTCDLLGYRENELVGKPIDLIVTEAEKDRRFKISEFLSRVTSENGEKRYLSKDNREIPVLFSGSVLKNEAGSIDGVVFVAQDITDRKKAEEALRKAHDELEIRVAKRTEELSATNQLLGDSLKEKEILLKEIHHRVKNNLQVISSLLYLQSKKIKDKETLTLFQDSQSRVKSMALIHEKLYQSQDLANINFSEYIKSLTKYLFRTYGTADKNIQLAVDVENVALALDSAIPCGLIINELVSNALKYAFKNKNGDDPSASSQSNRIEVRVSQNSDGKYKLIVRDNGSGFPETIDFRNTRSLGLQLVNNLTKQLEGTVELRNNHGTEFEITF